MNDPTPSRGARLTVALAVGAIFALYVVVCWRSYPVEGSRDIDQSLLATRVVLAGGDPYALVGPGRAVPSQFLWPYPLTAAVVLAPVAPFLVVVGRVAVVAIGAALIAYGATREGQWWRLWLFATPQAVYAAWSAQWSFLIAAGLVVPIAGAVWATKVNVGLACFIGRPSRAAFLGGAALVAASFALDPAWPLKWVHNVSTGAGHIVAPVMQWRAGGPLLLLAALRWRRPEARLLLAMACVRQNVALYETLPLMVMLPSSRLEQIALALCAMPAWYAQQTIGFFGWVTVAFVYLPCLVVVLRRPNEGPLPAWLERAVGRLAAPPRARDLVGQRAT